jgi:hypothetical protein
MENDLNDDDFELFLKQKVDQHKLYPSDNAWKGIYNSLHPGMKWFKVGGSLLILSTLFFIFQQNAFFSPAHSSLNKSSLSNSVSPQLSVTNANPSTVSSATTTAFNNHGVTGNKKSAGSEINSAGILLNSNELFNSGNAGQPSTPGGKSVAVNALDALNATTAKKDANAAYTLKRNSDLKGFFLTQSPSIKQFRAINVAIPSNHSVTSKESEPKSEADIAGGRDLKMSPVTANVLKSQEEISIKEINWLQEMAAIKLTAHKSNRFNIQFYFSPTVSYRKLADNQNSSHTGPLNGPAGTRDLNINSYVDHSPAIGAEIGSNFLYSASRNLTFKTGLQLNYNRYNIKAFRYFYEKASIALNTAGHIPDTLSSYTSIRNFNGYTPEQLQNQYLQVSVPIGAELKLFGNKRLQFNVAGTVQPTFLLFSDTYLLSTDYLNYTKEPSLVRKWNVHSSVEAFLSYKTGGFRWQVGPQFRYQLLSSYNDRYPIKEYLLEYGLKIIA